MPLDIAYRLNNKAVQESLSIDLSITMLVVALSPAVVATLLAASLRTPMERKRCVQLMTGPMDLDLIPERFSPEAWLDSPAGVLGYIYLLDILSAKVGASITSTVVGDGLYLLAKGRDIYLPLLGSVLLMYMVSIFPAWVRQIFICRLDIRLRYKRRIFFRKLRARFATSRS